MNFRTTVILLVILAAAGAYIAVTQLRGHNESTEAPSSSAGKLLNVNSADVTKIAITQPDGKKIVLDKSGSQWKLTEPVNAPADSFAVDDLLRQLTGLTSRGQLPTDQKTSVGLEHPNFVVELTTKDNKTAKLSVGDKNSIGDALYVLVNDQNKPEIVSASVYDQLDKPAGNFRSKKLVDATNDQIRQIAITHEGKTIKLEKDGNDWQIVEPKKMPGDPTVVSDLLWAITGLNAVDFVQNPKVPAIYGINEPVTKVWFSTVAATTQPAAVPSTEPAGTTISFGRFESVLQKNVFASVNGGPVVTVSTTSEESFHKTPLDLRDKKIVDIDPAQVERFTLSVNREATTQPTTRPSEQRQYTIVRRNETPVVGPMPPPSTQHASTEPATGPAVASTQPTTRPTAAATQPSTEPAPVARWTIDSGGSGDANDAQVDALLSALHPLRAEKFLEKAPSTQPSSSYTLTIHTGPSNGHGPQDFTLRFTNPGSTGNALSGYEDLTFEADRTILDKLDVNFKGGK